MTVRSFYVNARIQAFRVLVIIFVCRMIPLILYCFLIQVNGVRWHQCTYCTKEFKKPSDLVRHIRIHTHEKPYKCNQCFRAFAVKSTLTAHLKTHTGIKEFKCHVCYKMFATQGSLKVHIRLHTGMHDIQYTLQFLADILTFAVC